MIREIYRYATDLRNLPEVLFPLVWFAGGLIWYVGLTPQ